MRKNLGGRYGAEPVAWGVIDARSVPFRGFWSLHHGDNAQSEASGSCADANFGEDRGSYYVAPLFRAEIYANVPDDRRFNDPNLHSLIYTCEKYLGFSDAERVAEWITQARTLARDLMAASQASLAKKPREPWYDCPTHGVTVPLDGVTGHPCCPEAVPAPPIADAATRYAEAKRRDAEHERATHDLKYAPSWLRRWFHH